jgi:hypothetical protein
MANRSKKKAVSYRMDPNTIHILKDLAEKEGISQTTFLENLINEAYSNKCIVTETEPEETYSNSIVTTDFAPYVPPAPIVSEPDEDGCFFIDDLPPEKEWKTEDFYPKIPKEIKQDIDPNDPIEILLREQEVWDWS